MARDPHTDPRPGDILVADYPHDSRTELRETVEVVRRLERVYTDRTVLVGVVCRRSVLRAEREIPIEQYRRTFADWGVKRCGKE